MQQYRDHQSEIYDYINIVLKESAFNNELINGL